VLEIHPAKNFDAGSHYIVALRNLTDKNGTALKAPDAFRYYRDQIKSGKPEIEGRRAHFEQIFKDLKKAGILDSRRGKSGGYVMLRPADTISFGEVLRLFEGPLAPLPCLSRNAYRRCEDCVSEATCEIRREFGRAYDASRQVLDSRTLGDALHNNPYGVEPGHEVRRAG